jgi:hypothetical protein
MSGARPFSRSTEPIAPVARYGSGTVTRANFIEPGQGPRRLALVQPDVLVQRVGQLNNDALVFVRGQCGLQQAPQFLEHVDRRLAVAVGPMLAAVDPSLDRRVSKLPTPASVFGNPGEPRNRSVGVEYPRYTEDQRSFMIRSQRLKPSFYGVLGILVVCFFIFCSQKHYYLPN